MRIANEDAIRRKDMYAVFYNIIGDRLSFTADNLSIWLRAEEQSLLITFMHKINYRKLTNLFRQILIDSTETSGFFSDKYN